MSEIQGKRILVVDDDVDLLELLTMVLSRAKARVYTAPEGREGLRKFYAHQPDLVILDLMLPDLHGREVCRQIRQLSAVPIIILTVLTGEEETILGLDCGADDYVTKPFSVDVLLARVRAALRREVMSATTAWLLVYSDDYLTIDLNRRRVLVEGEPVKLSATEYRLLAFLLQNAGRVLSIGQILQQVWGPGCAGRVEYVHTYIWNLRQKLEQDPRQPRYLLSEHGVGYCFEKQGA
jgi:two-component system KDP operon response regulator KdpE